MEQRIKTCVLCDTKVEPYHVSCLKCLPLYLTYKNTIWMKDLVNAQRKQFEIDLIEYSNDKDTLINIDRFYPAQKKEKPYKKLSETDKKSIIQLKENGLGWRKISRILQLYPYTVKKFIQVISRNGVKTI